jgi:hypothetical protein
MEIVAPAKNIPIRAEKFRLRDFIHDPLYEQHCNSPEKESSSESRPTKQSLCRKALKKNPLDFRPPWHRFTPYPV